MTYSIRSAIVAGMAGAACLAAADTKVWLDEMPVKDMICGWQSPRVNKSVDGNALTIGSTKFNRGVGTHAESIALYDVDGGAVAFDADVGIDAEVFPGDGGRARLRFIVRADGRDVADSGVLSGKGESSHLHADLAGAKRVELFVSSAGNGIDFDHADWANAFFTMKDGRRPKPHRLDVKQLGILTPPPAPAPRVNGARVFGVRPGRPIIWRIPVTGERPMSLKAEGLPCGATFDAERGIVGGAVAKAGDYRFKVTASNAKGSATRELRLVVGDKIALTPPMGWNSWNCFAGAVTGKNIHDTIDVFDRSGLADHGWSYINIDDYWQNKPSARKDPTLQGPERNPDGSIAVNRRFPSMKALADYAHSKGLRIGLYSSPGPYTCGGCVGSWMHEWQDAKTYADWGYDYLKYDWCSYGGVAVGGGHGRLMLPYRLMGEALRAQNRDIVFSLCQYGMGYVSTWGESLGGNCWRTTGDITDTWDSMFGILHQQKDSWPYARPGAWNDPDMLVVGRLGWGRLRPTRLTPNEQYTHISLWSILCSPLLIGCDLTQLDDFTLSLLTNDEVIETSQDELGAQAACVAKGPRAEIWAKPMSDGSLVFALLNTYAILDTRITVDFTSLGLEGRWRVRDLWAQKDLGTYSSQYSADVHPHATHLVRFFPEQGAGLRKGLNDVRDNAIYSAYAETRHIDKPGYNAPAGPPCAECPSTRHR